MAGMVVQWLALSPHRKKVLALISGLTQSAFLYGVLHVLLVHAWAPFGFPTE